jgi:hypothetical protein
MFVVSNDRYLYERNARRYRSPENYYSNRLSKKCNIVIIVFNS